jgi:hypothetical protein
VCDVILARRDNISSVSLTVAGVLDIYRASPFISPGTAAPNPIPVIIYRRRRKTAVGIAFSSVAVMFVSQSHK